MKTVLAAIIILGIGVIGMCFNIIFRKNGKFPETEISRNENMRKMGIKCMREQDEEIFSKRSPEGMLPAQVPTATPAPDAVSMNMSSGTRSRNKVNDTTGNGHRMCDNVLTQAIVCLREIEL